jgi:SAM-dependent methyltransferase
MLTPRDRAAAYAAAFPRFPPLRADDRWLDGIWVMGGFYQGNGFYGSYPRGYMNRIRALFPDVWTPRRQPRESHRLLHLFSGSLSPREPGIRVDVHARRRPTVQASALQLPFRSRAFDLVMADPPYGPQDAERYGSPMPNRRRVLLEVARVTKPGGHLVYLDEVLPIFAKRVWHWWGVIGMTCGTNRRGRFVFMFERTRRA